MRARQMVRPEGLEPPTGGLEIRCSIRLSYGRIAWLARRAECITASEHLPQGFGISDSRASLPASR